ncbi:peroxisomal acyl-coenzyme A oxidase 1 isoform X2 [Lingula anatina]|uniref:Acyl-coenzyme A oxidase n=1 Tax=Lingula anatina TaxID=7574 RepID=A0A1S3H4A6_LINAN|nr:peroxisomal acyl-coenzyme A oxidase 1 isoform X2 [Lingula anatina]|eukprot:XP_013380838.1 peroxisomal acyl-coenzyme A oxidase 1 isoform X2 [Lingula anatina]
MAYTKEPDQLSIKTNVDLLKERQTATFDVASLTQILDGGKAKTRRRKQLESLVLSDPTLNPLDRSVDRLELYDRSLRKAARVYELKVKHNWSPEDMKMVLRMLNDEHALGVHEVMFIPCIERLGTAAQRAKWLPRAHTLEIIGTYAQTELGHGTNLAGLETTATYEPSSGQFILNTPTLSAMKWWPGNLAKTANHALVLAQLWIAGKKFGMQAFMVQLRSLEDHTLLPGIETGDIGPKMGVPYTDNGYLILKNVRIPRDHMLAGFAKVSADGQFSKVGSDQVNYLTMVYVRAKIVDWAFNGVSEAVTIATRYSAARRQGSMKPGDPEVQIMDYMTQQYKLFPALAAAYALFFAKEQIMKEYVRVTKEIQEDSNFKSLPEFHGILCGMKALSTTTAVEEIEVLHRGCGGHGYLVSSGLPGLLGFHLVLFTGEGENTVLYLQSARYLMKSFAKSTMGQPLPATVQYLSRDWSSYECPVRSERDCLNHNVISDIHLKRASYLVKRAADHLQRRLSAGDPQHVAWNRASIDLVTAAVGHAQAFVVCNFCTSLSQLDADTQILEVLSTLCSFYGLHLIIKHSGEFLEAGSISGNQLELIRRQEQALLAVIRPNAVALCDAFDYHDVTLNSALGGYDGNVYEELYGRAKQCVLNKTEVLPSYYKHIQPLQRRLKARL